MTASKNTAAPRDQEPKGVLIVGINYRPELTGIGPYTAGLAEHLAERGDDVTAITGLAHYPAWRIRHGTRRVLLHEEQINGVRVIRAAHYVPRHQSAINRATYEGTFALMGLAASLRSIRVDAVVGIVPSLSGGVIARATATRLRVPYGLLFQDLVGRAAEQSGMPGGGAVSRAVMAAETWSVAGARAVGVVATAFVPYLAALGVRKDRISHVPNWTRLAVPALTIQETRARYGWSDREQVVLHAGNMGYKQGLDQVIWAARSATERGDPVRFVLSGDGNQASSIRAAADQLDNVSCLGIQPDGIHASLLAAADVLLLSERPTQIDMSLPSKLTSYYAAGRPIVAAVPLDGSSAQEVARSGAGLLVAPGRPDLMLEALARLRSEPGLVATLAAAGPAYAAATTSEAACLARAADLVDRIAA